MAPDAAAIVRASFDARTLAEGASYGHDDVEYHEDPLWPGSGTYQGEDDKLRYIRAFYDTDEALRAAGLG